MFTFRKQKYEYANRDHEKGASILEFMAALVIFSIVSGAVFTAIEQVVVESNLTANAPAIYEHDQIIRFEISTTMDQFQRLLIVNKIAAGKTAGSISSNDISYCAGGRDGDLYNGPLGTLVRSQQNFAFPRTVYWGPKPFLLSVDSVSSVIEKFDDLKRKLTNGNTKQQYEGFKRALNRCQNPSIQEDTDNVGGLSSLYMCGYGADTLVELKIGFWDFLTGEPIPCNKLNSRPGRGVQAAYRYYQIEPYAERGRTLYAINRYTSKVFLPKKVDTNTHDIRGLWEE